MKKLSIIIPAYNEEKRIGKTFEDYGAFFGKRYGKEYEMIVVLNGCRDNTLKIVKTYERRYPQIRHLDFKQSGKGFAIMEGFKVADGKLIGFTDADDSTSASEFYRIIEYVDGFDGVIGSRYLEGSVVEPKQPVSRIAASRAFNLLVRSLFFMPFHDTQLGAKVFKKEAIKKVLPHLGITEWAFDIDLLYQMNACGFKIREISIEWHDQKGSKLNFVKTTVKMFFAIIRLRLINSRFNGTVKAYDKMPEWLKLHHMLK